MQLERIRVENLFGRFTYDISLRRPEKITIIHAPNGFGKTALLTLINAFFSRQFSVFYRCRFGSLHLYFDNRDHIEIRKADGSGLFPDMKAEVPSEVFVALESPSLDQQLEPYKLAYASLSPSAVNRTLPFIEPVGPDLWQDENVGDVISTHELIQRWGHHLPPAMRKTVDYPDWLIKIMDSTECRLIETQRLLRITRSDENLRTARRQPAGPRAVVEVEARDLANRIGLTLGDYANSSQVLDQSFPKRVILALGSKDVPESASLTTRLHTIDEKRSSLIAAGLLDKSGAPEILTQAELRGKEVRQVIGVYLDDMEQKLSRFDQLFKRVSLFKEIIGEKFQFKDVLVSREKGISVKTDVGTEISLTDLSSGEQHELVLLYELLFGVRDDALILIDEPELSLHVGWQVRFLPDLQRIQEVRPMQIIMATHSPQIINDRWDLTEELKHN